MHSLATYLRYLQLLAHSGHHLTNGCTFFQDHSFLGELYAAYEEAFDDVTERMIGLGELVSVEDRMALDSDATGILGGVKVSDLTCAEDWFELLLEGEDNLCSQIEKLAKGKVSQGTLNLLAQLADDSEKRQYKLGQRITPDEDDAAEGETSEDDGDEIKRAY